MEAGSSSVGVYGNSSGFLGTGVYGNASGPFGAGVSGFSSDSAGVFGRSSSGPGVSAISDSGNGVDGSSTSGIGVRGLSTSGDLLVGQNPIGIKFRVANNGNVHAPAYQALPDFAEEIRPSPADTSRLEPGDVLIAAPQHRPQRHQITQALLHLGARRLFDRPWIYRHRAPHRRRVV